MSVNMAQGLPLPSDDGHEHLLPGLKPLVEEAMKLDSRAESSPGAAQEDQGIGITSFLTAIVASIIIFSVQTGFFVLLRNKLARIL